MTGNDYKLNTRLWSFGAVFRRVLLNSVNKRCRTYNLDLSKLSNSCMHTARKTAEHGGRMQHSWACSAISCVNCSILTLVRCLQTDVVVGYFFGVPGIFANFLCVAKSQKATLN